MTALASIVPGAPAAHSIRDQVSAEEWALRVVLAAAFRLVAYYGWDALASTPKLW